MNIAVCLKVVPDTDLHLDLDPFSNRLEALSLFYEINPHDLIALHEALDLKAQTHGRVAVYHAGPDSSKALLRRVLLAGVDEVNLIRPLSQSHFSRSDIKISLSEQFKSDRPDVIFCGAESTDEMNGDFAAQLANELDLDFVSQVMRAVFMRAENTSIEIERLVAPGWVQRVRCPIPLVLSTISYSPTDAAKLELALLPEQIDKKVQVKNWSRLDPRDSASGIWEYPSTEIPLRKARNRFRPILAPDSSLSAADRISTMYSSQGLREGGVTITGTPEESVDLLLNLLDDLNWPLTKKRE